MRVKFTPGSFCKSLFIANFKLTRTAKNCSFTFNTKCHLMIYRFHTFNIKIAVPFKTYRSASKRVKTTSISPLKSIFVRDKLNDGGMQKSCVLMLVATHRNASKQFCVELKILSLLGSLCIQSENKDVNLYFIKRIKKRQNSIIESYENSLHFPKNLSNLGEVTVGVTGVVPVIL